MWIKYANYMEQSQQAGFIMNKLNKELEQELVNRGYIITKVDDSLLLSKKGGFMNDPDLELIQTFRQVYLTGWNSGIEGYPPELDEKLLNELYNEYQRGYKAAVAYKNSGDKV